MQLNPVLALAHRQFEPRLVSINARAIQDADLTDCGQGLQSDLPESLLKDREEFIAFRIAMGVLNFCFWRMDDRGVLARYEHAGKVGALAMADAFLSAWTSTGLPEGANRRARLRILRERTREGHGVQALFGDIPMAEDRAKLLHEVLEPTALSIACQAIAFRISRDRALGWQDATLLANLFPSGYGQDPFLKKAQLTLMFIAADSARVGRKLHRLEVTAASDYQLPKVLRSQGVLVYSDELASTVDSNRLILSGGGVETAIRAATIVAVDILCRTHQVSVAEVDFWLWKLRNNDRSAKFHLTLTTNY